jgi:hypothetical protein
MKQGIVLTVALFAIAAVALVADYKHRTAKEPECPYGFVCYAVDESEEVQWRDGYDTVTFTVKWYYTYEQLQAFWTAEGGEGEVDAWNECWDFEDGSRRCDIHVVRPRYVWGDPRIDDLGHEVLHGFLDTEEGNFHE